MEGKIHECTHTRAVSAIYTNGCCVVIEIIYSENLHVCICFQACGLDKNRKYSVRPIDLES